MFTLVQDLHFDLRFALRQLRRTPGFTLLALLTLALGIGAATAVFSLVDTVLLRPLPFPQPDRVVALDTLVSRVQHSGSAAALVPDETSYPNFFDWRARARSFDALASWQGQSFTLGDGSGSTAARRIDGLAVSADFFRVLGVAPTLGRTFTRAEEQPGNRSVLVSHALWQTALDASPTAIGRTLHLSDETYTVIGVLPASFQFPNAPDAQAFITPAPSQEGTAPSGQQRGWSQVSVIGRLAPGVSLDRARAEMLTIQHALVLQYPDDDRNLTGVSIVPQLQDLVGDVQRPLNILFASVCFLLLIACANVAGLLLTRTSSRRPELALRAALGATRLQIVRQLLVESLALSLLGGLAGLVLAALALDLAPTFLPSDLPRLNELALNPRVFLFAFAASVATGLLFGVLPAWRLARLDPATALRDRTRSSTASAAQTRLQGALVIAETALGLILLIGAGLMIRSFNKLLAVDPGFNPAHLITFRVGMPPRRFQDQRLLQLSQQLQDRFAALPGVQHATFGYPIPLTGGDMSISFSIPGQPTAPGDQPTARVAAVSSNFFAALQLPLLRGRFFTPAEDQPTAPPVVLVNHAFAARYFPGQDALGRHITSGISSTSLEIIGIVGDINHTRLDETAQPEYFVPFAHSPVGPPVFALRVAGDPRLYDQPVRAAVAAFDPSLPVYSVRTNLLTRSTAQQRFQTSLIAAFAALALLLAAIGLYGVLSFMVTQRTLELGLRMALGARRGDVLRLVLARGLTLATAGVLLGLVASLLLTRYLQALLFATRSLDLATFAAVTLLLFAISALSSLAPALRAARLNPNDTLRQQ